jgi:hypothetical protein
MEHRGLISPAWPGEKPEVHQPALHSGPKSLSVPLPDRFGRTRSIPDSLSSSPPSHLDFFSSNFVPLINLIIEMTLFLILIGLITPNIMVCFFKLGHTKHPDATHDHVAISCHVNPNGSAISFGKQNESHHAD